MSVLKKIFKGNECKLKGALRKCGFDRWRFVFNAANSSSGEESNFFIELSILNPAISSEKPVVYEIQGENLRAESLQAALTGNLNTEKKFADVIPSYCCMRAGILGAHPKQIARYFSCDSFVSKKNAFDIKVGECVFGERELCGSLTVTRDDAQKCPHLKSDVGRIVWNLKYESVFGSHVIRSKKSFSWFPIGINTKFSGSVVFDGVEYVVSPENSFGYADKNWGPAMDYPFVHISSPRLTSIFTGKIMGDSGFALEGNFDGKCALLAKFGDEEYSFGKKKKIRRFNSIWSCAKVPSNSGDENLHWSISLNGRKFIIDVDVFCDASEMIVKDYDMPCGGGLVLKVLGSASARGEIRLYRQRRKSLELIQHAKILNAVAEYGMKDMAEA